MGTHNPSSFIHPQLKGDDIFCYFDNVCPQVCPDCKTDLLICCISAPFIGGMQLYVSLFPCKQIEGASFISLVLLDRSYMTTTYLSSTRTSSSVMLSDRELKELTVSAAVSKTFHACQADFFPLPTNEDTVSQPVNAWNNHGNAFDFGPNDRAMS